MTRNKQGVFCTPAYDRKHPKKKLAAMLRRGYDAYGEGGFFCHICETLSPSRHLMGCTNLNPRARYSSQYN